jgi:hypothetical protein
MEKLDKKSLYNQGVYDEIVSRISTLTSKSQPEWGKMTSAQMLAHCSEIVEVTNGKELHGTPWFVKLLGGLIKKMVLSVKPYPRETGTHPQYVVSDEREFEVEKTRLLRAIETFVAEDEAMADEKKHPIFGRMTRDEKGWAMYKHLDHHLSQFRC